MSLPQGVDRGAASADLAERSVDGAPGELTQEQIDAQIAEQWYRPHIARPVLKDLMKRSDAAGLRNFVPWLVVLVASGVLAGWTWGTWWAVPAFFVYGTIYSSSDARWHELAHGTPFRTRWLNDAFYHLSSFMTIREACDLVLTAATHALTPARPDVSVYVLNMGQPVKIVELAERMIRLSGLEPGIDIEVVFSGMRPGERLNEILFASEEPAVEIGVAGIMAAKPNEPPMQTLRKWLAALEDAIARDDRSTIRAVLKDAVPEFGSNAA